MQIDALLFHAVFLVAGFLAVVILDRLQMAAFGARRFSLQGLVGIAGVLVLAAVSALIIMTCAQGCDYFGLVLIGAGRYILTGLFGAGAGAINLALRDRNA